MIGAFNILKQGEYNPGRFIVGQCLLGRGIRYNNAIISLCISSYN
jgi:hypothetical protein